jgi:poly(3-hydroxybutyrate) depolymerase
MTVRFLVIALSINSLVYAETHIEKNVIYGMYSGLALLMDIHHPAKPNRHGLILIQGSGWNSSQTYDAQPLTMLTSSIRFFVPALLDAGYTLFVVNHRNGPRFHYPAAVEDVQRATRYIRYNANQYGIDPDRIGAFGYSSGAYLAVMLGVLDGTGDAHDPDPVNRVSVKVQCLVGSATPTDLQVEGGSGDPAVASFRGSYGHGLQTRRRIQWLYECIVRHPLLHTCPLLPLRCSCFTGMRIK